jgi:hypothetical protein
MKDSDLREKDQMKLCKEMKRKIRRDNNHIVDDVSEKIRRKFEYNIIKFGEKLRKSQEIKQSDHTFQNSVKFPKIIFSCKLHKQFSFKISIG